MAAPTPPKRRITVKISRNMWPPELQYLKWSVLNFQAGSLVPQMHIVTSYGLEN